MTLHPLARAFCPMLFMPLAFVLMVPADGQTQGRSGQQSVDACQVVTAEEVAQALGRKVQSRAVPPSQPVTLGVSVCMWATADGRRTLSVTTYGPEAVKRTRTSTLQMYYDSVKTSNANLARRPAKVVPGVARHASIFPSSTATGWTILVLRHDCVVTINATGITEEQAVAIAKTAGTP
jgi:hypothetical protein